MVEKMNNESAREAEQVLMQYQMQGQQLENTMAQKQALVFQKAEIEAALKETETGSEIFKIVGPIIVKKSKEDIKIELEDKNEELDLMIKQVERNEKKLKEMVEKCKEKLQQMLPALQASQNQGSHKCSDKDCEECGE
jgi:prefoldin beta subunit